uniref:Uncharacterized protein n=1 Tax=Arundo donax TaxID=35708 RepID=A0A0A9AT88_ARUDO
MLLDANQTYHMPLRDAIPSGTQGELIIYTLQLQSPPCFTQGCGGSYPVPCVLSCVPSTQLLPACLAAPSSA